MIKELKAALAAAGWSFPVRFDEFVLVDDGCELICHTDGLTETEMELIVEGLNSLPALLEAVELLDYFTTYGVPEVPPYDKLDQALALLTKLKGEPKCSQPQ